MPAAPSQAVTIREAGAQELDLLFAVRREVFVAGQGVPPEREIDGLDAEALHFIALDGDAPVGTARMRIVGSHAKVERVAVREPWRGRGTGGRIMDAAEAKAAELGLGTVVVSAQVPVIAFYERRGYVARGPVYEDAGLPHRTMEKTLGGRDGRLRPT